MSEKDFKLLRSDLCARIPYRVKLQVEGKEVQIRLREASLNCVNEMFTYDEVKPILRPMTDMTSEEQVFRATICGMWESAYEYDEMKNVVRLMDFYYSRHLDIHGLIPLGLAVKARKGFYDSELERLSVEV